MIRRWTRLIDLVIAAPDRASLVARTRALDRVLLAGHYMIPHFHITAFRVALLGPLRPAGLGAEERDRLRHVVGRPEPEWDTPLVLAYLARRLLLVIPTLVGIMLANFLIVQAAPGGPVDLMLARLRGHTSQATARIGATGTGETATGRAARPGGGDDDLTRGTRGIDPELVRQLEKQFGFDKPAWQRFVHMMRSYLVFDLGTSFYRDRPVLGLMLEKLPVSVSLGLWTTLLVYLISIPLGVAKAVRDGTPFDVWTSAAVIVGYAIPGFLFAILLVVLMAGGSFVQWFPLRGLTSDTWALHVLAPAHR